MACGKGGNEEWKEEGKEDGREEMKGFACNRGLFCLRPLSYVRVCIYALHFFRPQQREKENRNQKTAARF